MRKLSRMLAGAAAVAAAAALVAGSVTAASADPIGKTGKTVLPLSYDIAGVGSNTTQQAQRVSHYYAFFLAAENTPGGIVESGPTAASFDNRGTRAPPTTSTAASANPAGEESRTATSLRGKPQTRMLNGSRRLQSAHRATPLSPVSTVFPASPLMSHPRSSHRQLRHQDPIASAEATRPPSHTSRQYDFTHSPHPQKG